MIKIECQIEISEVWDRCMQQHEPLRYSEAIFDPEQLHLFLPSEDIERLDLMPQTPRQCLLNGVARNLKRYAAVKLTINQRFCSIDVLEVPDLELPILGVIPLRLLDFVVDYEQRCLIGNPEHGDEELHDLLVQAL